MWDDPERTDVGACACSINDQICCSVKGDTYVTLGRRGCRSTTRMSPRLTNGTDGRTWSNRWTSG